MTEERKKFRIIVITKTNIHERIILCDVNHEDDNVSENMKCLDGSTPRNEETNASLIRK